MTWRHTKVILAVLFTTAFAMVVTACDEEPTPVVVVITETPVPSQLVAMEAEDTDEGAASIAEDAGGGVFLPGPTATPSSTVDPDKPTETVTPTPTVTHTLTYTPETATDVPPPPLPNVPPADQLPVLYRQQMGVQIHPFVGLEEWSQLLGLANQIGVGWVKFQISWEQLEPQRGQYSERFHDYVLRIQNIHNAGLRVFLSIVDAPSWARPEGHNPDLKGPPANPQDLANFIQQLIIATKPEDNRIQAIEIWNEPNLRDREWEGVPLGGQKYMEYFVPAYEAIKATDPQITVVTAGLAPVGDGIDGVVGDRRFLQQMYDAGLANYPDVRVGIHPYSWANPPDTTCCTEERGWANNPVFYFQDTLNEYIDIMQRNGHNTQLWITELGWGTYKGIGVGGVDVPPPAGQEFFNLISLEQQAEYTIRALEMVQHGPLSEHVEMTILWNLNFAMVPRAIDEQWEQAGYSMMDAGGHPRLVFYYLSTSRRQEP